MKKWLEALRSNKYKQGRLFLNSNNEFCCLGVLCDLEKENIEDIKNHGNGEHGYVEYNGCTAYLPDIIADKYKLVRGEEQVKLANMNDNGKTFLEIADYIEQHLMAGREDIQ